MSKEKQPKHTDRQKAKAALLNELNNIKAMLEEDISSEPTTIAPPQAQQKPTKGTSRATPKQSPQKKAAIEIPVLNNIVSNIPTLQPDIPKTPIGKAVNQANKPKTSDPAIQQEFSRAMKAQADKVTEQIIKAYLPKMQQELSKNLEAAAPILLKQVLKKHKLD